MTFAELGDLGFKFIFITLGGQHAMSLGLNELLVAMADRQEQGYIELQRREWRASGDVPTRSHHQFSGVPYHHLMGEEYSSARLGRDFVEELPTDRVV
jgi:isocitrate lyase